MMCKVRAGILKKSDIPEFKWMEDCQTGFDNLKNALTSAPILAYPDYSKPFILETDASLKGLDAVLSQRSKDNTIRVIAYASRSLRPGEKSMKDYSSAKDRTTGFEVVGLRKVQRLFIRFQVHRIHRQ